MSVDSRDEIVSREDVTASYASLDSDARYRGSSSGPGGGSTATGDPPLSPGADEFIDIQGPDMTALALQKCETYVLTPYKTLLKCLGWTPFTRDGDSRCLKVLRACLVIFWVLVMMATFITQILSCFRRDRFIPGTLNITNVTYRTVMCRQHLISNFILPDLLLLASYLFGLFLFSRDETEYLSNLAEKVFIKNAKMHMHINDPKMKGDTSTWLIVTLSGFLLAGLLWIILSFGVRLMTSFSVELWDDSTIIEWPTKIFMMASKNALVALSIIGFLFFDTIYVTAVMNYAAQSEMNIVLLRAIRYLVTKKQYMSFDAAIKDILECRGYLRVLNGKTATATALILFNLGSAALVGIINLNNISENDVSNDILATITAGFNVILWCLLVFFPFIQAARVTDACNKLKATGPEIRSRPLEYVNAPQIELDSYIGLTQAVRMRATMFGIPIYPWLVWFVIVAFTFTALILFQTGAYNFAYYL